jgi:hypothetical protein
MYLEAMRRGQKTPGVERNVARRDEKGDEGYTLLGTSHRSIVSLISVS